MNPTYVKTSSALLRGTGMHASKWHLAIVATMACAICARAENLYEGGDFEKDHVKWSLPTNGFWSFKDGEGRGGSRALVLEQPTNAPYTGPTMDAIKVTPKASYRFYMWVKKDSYNAPRGRLYVSFAWSDANGKSIDSCEGVATADNAVDGWACYEATTAPLPRNAAWGRFYIWMSHGVNGRLRFDDFTIEQLPSDPTVEKIVTSAYQDRIDRGPVKVVAEYVVNPDTYPDGDLSGVLEYPLARGGRAKTPVVINDGFAVGSFNAEELPLGTSSIAFALSCRGKEIARGDLAFERTRNPPTRKVMFDAMHRTVVDGKRFFPLGMYWHAVTKKDIDKYKEAPFNCLMPYNGSGTNMLDLCHRAGLKVIYTLKSGWKDAKDPVKEEAYIMRALRFKDHPAILAWYICDELPSSLASLLVKRHRRIREIDPEHPTWIVLDKPKHARAFLGGFDVIANDPYPLGYYGSGLDRGLHLVSGNPQFIADQIFGTRPLWQVPQVFDWGDYFPFTIGRPNVRWPNLDEMRSMTWQAVAAGVNGLVYYSFFDIWRERHGKENSEAHWRDVVTLAKEVKKMERVLLSDDRPFDLAGADRKKVVWRCYSCDGADWLLVANRNTKPYAAELALPAKYSSLDVALGGGVSLANGGSALKVDLPGFGYAFIKLNAASGDAMSAKYRELWNDEVQARIDARIEKCRKADATVEVGAHDGADVKVEQVSHAFKFGAHIFNFDQLGSKEANDIYKATYTNLFNAATVAYYWSSYEPTKGHFRHAAGPHDNAAFWDSVSSLSSAEKYERFIEYRRPAPDPILDFCAANGIDAHGHAMIYRISQPDWVAANGASDADVIAKYCQHIKELAAHCGTRISQWDVVNTQGTHPLPPRRWAHTS